MSRNNLVVSFSYPAYPSLSLPRLCAHVSRTAKGSERGQTVAPPPSSLLQKRESGNCHLLTTFAETVVLPFGTPADGEGLSR